MKRALAAFVAVSVLGGWYAFGQRERWRCHDGDTCRNLATGESVRLIGIDAPEIGRGARCTREQQLAEAARAYLQYRIDHAGTLVVELRDRYPDGRRDRYGRRPGIFWADGVNLSDELIQGGYGREYHGGVRQTWCP